MNFLVPVCDYIKQSLKNGAVNNSIKLYKLIANIKDNSIANLHVNVARSLPYLYNSPSLLIEFASIAFPFIASNDILEFISFASDLANGLCKHSLWDEAYIIVQDVLKVDPQNSKCKLILLMIEYHSNTYDSLLTEIENSDSYIQIEDLIPTLYKSGVINLVNILKSRINELIINEEFDKAASWLYIVTTIDFEDRDNFFKSIINTCKTRHKSDKVFWIAIHTFTNDHLKFVIDSTMHFISELLFNGYFILAKKILQRYL